MYHPVFQFFKYLPIFQIFLLEVTLETLRILLVCNGKLALHLLYVGYCNSLVNMLEGPYATLLFSPESGTLPLSLLSGIY